jgi:hypothetical protein
VGSGDFTDGTLIAITVIVQ